MQFPKVCNLRTIMRCYNTLQNTPKPTRPLTSTQYTTTLSQSHYKVVTARGYHTYLDKVKKNDNNLIKTTSSSTKSTQFQQHQHKQHQQHQQRRRHYSSLNQPESQPTVHAGSKSSITAGATRAPNQSIGEPQFQSSSSILHHSEPSHQPTFTSATPHATPLGSIHPTPASTLSMEQPLRGEMHNPTMILPEEKKKRGVLRTIFKAIFWTIITGIAAGNIIINYVPVRYTYKYFLFHMVPPRDVSYEKEFGHQNDQGRDDFDEDYYYDDDNDDSNSENKNEKNKGNKKDDVLQYDIVKLLSVERDMTPSDLQKMCLLQDEFIRKAMYAAWMKEQAIARLAANAIKRLVQIGEGIKKTKPLLQQQLITQMFDRSAPILALRGIDGLDHIDGSKIVLGRRDYQGQNEDDDEEDDDDDDEGAGEENTTNKKTTKISPMLKMPQNDQEELDFDIQVISGALAWFTPYLLRPPDEATRPLPVFIDQFLFCWSSSARQPPDELTPQQLAQLSNRVARQAAAITKIQGLYQKRTEELKVIEEKFDEYFYFYEPNTVDIRPFEQPITSPRLDNMQDYYELDEDDMNSLIEVVEEDEMTGGVIPLGLMNASGNASRPKITSFDSNGQLTITDDEDYDENDGDYDPEKLLQELSRKNYYQKYYNGGDNNQDDGDGNDKNGDNHQYNNIHHRNNNNNNKKNLLMNERQLYNANLSSIQGSKDGKGNGIVDQVTTMIKKWF